MQDKHVVIYRAGEDRDIFINKCTLPKTVYQIVDRGIPEEGDIVVGNHQVTDWVVCKYILDNYENLSEYTIFTSADPRDHVVSLETAIHCKFTSGYGSFCFARSIYSQYTFGWFRIHPTRMLAHLLGLGYHNDNNTIKNIYPFEPGIIFYVHRDRILQHPKSFYENMIYWDNDEKLKDYYLKHEHPNWFWNKLSKSNPDTKSKSKKEILEKSIYKNSHHGSKQDFFGITCESLWPSIFKTKKELNLLEKSQAVIGNKLYFNLNLENYDSNFSFSIYPFEDSDIQTKINLLLMENNWFDYEDQTYLNWREKLLEKLYFEFNKIPGEDFDTFWNREKPNNIHNNDTMNLILENFRKIGYKHISM